MKISALALLPAILGFGSIACHKSSGIPVSPASLNIINAMPTSNPIIPVIGTQEAIQYFSSAQAVYYQNAQLYSPLSGPNSVYVVQATDTTALDLKQKMFSGTLSLQAGGIYSLFLAGDTTQPDTLFIQDHIPYYTDSSAGVRFVNLSPGSQPMTITLQGNPASQQEFSNLAYRSASTFNKYSAGSAVGNSYNFTVRDQATGDSLTSFTWYFTLFKNNTLVLSGSEANGSATPLTVFQINNY